jgi:hypothetical protein
VFTHKELVFLKQLVFQARSLSLENYDKYATLFFSIEHALRLSNISFIERCQDRGLDFGHEEWYNGGNMPGGGHEGNDNDIGDLGEDPGEP